MTQAQPMDPTERILQQGKALVRAIEARETMVLGKSWVSEDYQGGVGNGVGEYTSDYPS